MSLIVSNIRELAYQSSSAISPHSIKFEDQFSPEEEGKL